MKNKLNMWPTKARLSSTHVLTPRTELTKVQERYAQVEAKEGTDHFSLLPVGCWSMNNAGGIYTINLHSDVLHSVGCQYLRGFSGHSAEEAASKAAEWVLQVKGGEDE